MLISGCKKNDLVPGNQSSLNSGDAEDAKTTAIALSEKLHWVNCYFMNQN